MGLLREIAELPGATAGAAVSAAKSIAGRMKRQESPQALVNENQMRRQRGTTSPGRNAAGFYNSPDLYGGIDNSSWVAELVAELVWPRDLETFQRMRRSDHQVEAILRSIELPIEQGQFAVRAPPEATAEEQTIADAIEDAYLRRLDGGWEMAVRAALTHLAVRVLGARRNLGAARGAGAAKEPVLPAADKHHRRTARR